MNVRLDVGAGKYIVASIDDKCLFSERTNDSTRWTEYYAHRSRAGKIYFYGAHYTMWQGEHDTYRYLSKEEIVEELSEYKSFDDIDREAIEEFIPDFFEETA